MTRGSPGFPPGDRGRVARDSGASSVRAGESVHVQVELELRRAGTRPGFQARAGPGFRAARLRLQSARPALRWPPLPATRLR